MFEILSTASMVGVWGASFYFSKKQTNKDHEKIVQIADALGLKTKDHSIRIYRKRKHKNYTEYVYKIPLGLSFKQFQEQTQTFVDGLNNKSRPDLKLSNFKNIQFNRDIIKQIQDAFNHRTILDKHIEMEYDGMLKVRVFDEGLKKNYPTNTEIMSKGNKWTVPLGVAQNSIVEHNFESSPHMLIGGTTDSGKSTTLNNIIATLVHKNPDDVEFTLIDLKGGLEFGDYEHIKQTKNFAIEIDEAERILRNLKEQMVIEFERLREKRKRKVQQTGIRKRHFVIIDEAAELSIDGEKDPKIKHLKIECENHIKSIAARGRACGVRVIYSTQYPTKETINSQIKRNLITRICFPVDSSTASKVVLDEVGAESLPIIQGRAIYKRHKCTEIQSYNIDEKLIQSIIKPHVKEGERASHKTKKPSKTRENPFELKEL